MLERFRTQYAAYKAIHPRLQLYALIDIAAIPDNRQYALSDIIETMPRVSLYANIGLDNLAETGPVLVPCPEPEGVEPLRLIRVLLGLARRDSRLVSWLWVTHEVEPLVDHLQTLLHARLESDGQESWFFFHQPAYLPVLYRTLPEDSHRYMFGPCVAWWCLDFHGALVELPGENLPIPTAWDVFPVPENVEEEIYRVGAPAQVLAWLQRARPDVLDNTLDANEQLQRITPFVGRAFGYGLTGKVDQGVYAATGLLYGRRYDEHPALQAVLTRLQKSRQTLIDAYMAVGDTVWREVGEAARLRAAEAAAQEYHASLMERGYTFVRVQILNDTDIPRRKIELLSSGESYPGSAMLGDVDARGFEATAIGIASARVPVPGTAVTVKWIGPTGASSDEVVVTGDLPRADGEGVAVVRFARNWRIYVSMHADELKLQVRS
ncbi:DUF4123 domain-containing protein [Paraburkholderia sp. CNPSo 3272]|uniref:DUF4123 domain-containing protein n=1 Tax=Paraburkholderia sp. CNPSo 3272 TaxID=2940931 RepID=UPI0020B7FA33|nr:DUF4123 domain-containing protein [Paraburkholderia sp. CNPSo 3272]MCP3726042.1 DUF4123 domain-containing protein [Paraburkholderia sp. CNPSo 3272]